jgi:RHS repeat-associated protein
VAFARRRSHQRRVPILLTLLRLGLLKTTGALTNSAAPTYDAAGNTLTINGAVYAYDQKNQLKSISGLDSNGAMGTVNHQYDSMGRRISSTVNNQSILYVYDGWNVVEEYSSSNLQSFDLKTILTWGIDLSGSAQGAGGVGGLLFTEDITSNTTWHHHYDGNGNVTHLTNASGQTVATYTYDAFGNTVTATGVAATANRYRFSTKPIDEHIATTPLYYYGYRYYHPQTGRWINRDPIEEDGGLNLYGFVGNDGLNWWDYLGLIAKVPEKRADGTDVPEGKVGRFTKKYSIDKIEVKGCDLKFEATGWSQLHFKAGINPDKPPAPTLRQEEESHRGIFEKSVELFRSEANPLEMTHKSEECAGTAKAIVLAAFGLYVAHERASQLQYELSTRGQVTGADRQALEVAKQQFATAKQALATAKLKHQQCK